MTSDAFLQGAPIWRISKMSSTLSSPASFLEKDPLSWDSEAHWQGCYWTTEEVRASFELYLDYYTTLNRRDLELGTLQTCDSDNLNEGSNSERGVHWAAKHQPGSRTCDLGNRTGRSRAHLVQLSGRQEARMSSGFRSWWRDVIHRVGVHKRSMLKRCRGINSVWGIKVRLMEGAGWKWPEKWDTIQVTEELTGVVTIQSLSCGR